MINCYFSWLYFFLTCSTIPVLILVFNLIRYINQKEKIDMPIRVFLLCGDFELIQRYSSARLVTWPRGFGLSCWGRAWISSKSTEQKQRTLIDMIDIYFYVSIFTLWQRLKTAFKISLHYSDIWWRQILTYKDGLRTGRTKNILMAVDP